MELEGALWIATDRDSGEKRKDKNGNTFFTGTVTVNGEKHKVVAFLNKPKTNPAAPDIKILISKPMEGSYRMNQTAQATAQGTAQPTGNPGQFKDDEFEGGIPF